MINFAAEKRASLTCTPSIHQMTLVQRGFVLLVLHCTGRARWAPIYFLHSIRRKQQIVNTIEVLIAKEADLDLPWSFTAQLNDSDLRAECSPKLGLGGTNVGI